MVSFDDLFEVQSRYFRFSSKAAMKISKKFLIDTSITEILTGTVEIDHYQLAYLSVRHLWVMEF